MTAEVGAGSGVPGAVPGAVQVVEPTSVQEVADILRSAAADGVPVTPVGVGRPGGAAPDGPKPGGSNAGIAESGIVLSTRRLNGLEIYEPADLTVTAAAGTTLGELAAAVAEHDQWAPFDPPHGPKRTLGALVATGEGGPLSAGYGAPRDHVLGVTLVTGAGTVLKLGGRVMKNVAGFDLVRLVVGSRGSLGVVVSACIRVFPRPGVDRILVLEGEFPELLAAARAMATAPVVPASAVLARTDVHAGARLVVRLHGSQAMVDADQATMARRVQGSFQVMEGEAAVPVLESARDACYDEAVVLLLTALPARLPELLAEGGDGSFVADVIAGRVHLAPHDRTETAVRALVRRAEDLGGSARILVGPQELRGIVANSGPAVVIADKLRAVFDPNGIMRPGGGTR